MSIIDQKITTAQFLTNELTRYSDKVNFVGDRVLVDAMRYLEEKGIPNAKQEDYKYCNVEAILKKEFRSLGNKYNTIEKETLHRFKTIEGCINLFIVNGRFESEASDISELPAGLTVSAIHHADQTLLSKYSDVNTDAFVALNTLYAAHGVFINLSAKTGLEKPLHIIEVTDVSENTFANIRNLIVARKGAQLNVIVSSHSLQQGTRLFTNSLTEVVLEEDARICESLIQQENKHSYRVNTTQVYQQKNSNYSNNTFTFDGAMVRNNLNVVIDAENAEAHLNGLFIAGENQLIDNHTLVDHRKPHCNSNELYKGIVSDKATGVFNGKIFVQKDAQKTNAYQSSKNILLSDDATMNTKPQLEIYADDVKCSHGTSTGKIDEEAVFYLKSRGIGGESARRLLMLAFAGEVIEKIQIQQLKDHLEELISLKLM